MTVADLKTKMDQVLDHLIAEGQPFEFEHKGTRFEIRKVTSGNKLDRLVARPEAIVGDPEELVHMDWSGETNLDLP
jgi:hypothetical protein